MGKILDNIVAGLQKREDELWIEFERLCPDPKVKSIALELIAINIELEDMSNI